MEDQVNDSKFRNLRPKNKSVPEDIKQKNGGSKGKDR